jgi:hypothetical protein
VYRHWTAAEDRLFRKYGNQEIAQRTGRPITGVQSRKQVLRRAGAVLPYLVKVRRAEWTPAKDKIVAENRTSVAMRLLDHSRDTIKRRRKALGLVPWISPKKPKRPTRPPRLRWTVEEDRLVVTLPFGEAVKAIGRRTRTAVYLRRATLRRKGKQLKWNRRKR